MKTITLLVLFSAVTTLTQAQIISLFTFDSDPITTATIGPNATSVSGSAFSDVGGVGGTNGLNAGLPKADLDFTIPGSPTFDIPGIDVSFDYQREENFGHFWRRGNSLVISGSASLSVSYRVEDGMGGFNTVNSGAIYAIPFDDTYRTYRFYYVPTTGVGALLVDGVIRWINDGPDNRDMYWVGAGDVVIGDGLDGNGDNKTFLDNVIVGQIIDSPLPIELIEFSAELNGKKVDLNWTTASEKDNDYFTIERSADGRNWEKIGIIDGAGTSTHRVDYAMEDKKPLPGISYYRLKQTDFSGKFTYSKMVQMELKTSLDIQLYPNPADDQFSVSFDRSKPYELEMYSAHGQRITLPHTESGNEIVFNCSELNPGVYLLQVLQSGISETVRVMVR